MICPRACPPSIRNTPHLLTPETAMMLSATTCSLSLRSGVAANAWETAYSAASSVTAWCCESYSVAFSMDTAACAAIAVSSSTSSCENCDAPGGRATAASAMVHPLLVSGTTDPGVPPILALRSRRNWSSASGVKSSSEPSDSRLAAGDEKSNGMAEYCSAVFSSIPKSALRLIWARSDSITYTAALPESTPAAMSWATILSI